MKTSKFRARLLAWAAIFVALAIAGQAKALTMQGAPYQQVQAVTTSYTAGSDGIITGVNPNDFSALLQAGFVSLGAANGLLGRLLGANMNVTTDQPIPMFVPANQNYRITKITVKNCSISMTTAAGGVYPQASKGGTAIVANSQVYTGLSASTLALDLTIATTPGLTYYAGTVDPTFSLTTAQGAAGTCDIFVEGQVGN